jgi:hypothetical protein
MGVHFTRGRGAYAVQPGLPTSTLVPCGVGASAHSRAGSMPCCPHANLLAASLLLPVLVGPPPLLAQHLRQEAGRTVG